ncbi:uncharacterized protein LOC143289324 [Babylonia areolata]|uniref:uncharacterized protein LOC143289324 n=1 Tax=Babylonia areolata TaxID=304850 RepID=UPI003FD20177
MSGPSIVSTTAGAEGGGGGGEKDEVFEDFLDDPYNMAMYVVLPLMVLIYGGCGFIYCMAKLHRFCRRRARRNAKRKLIQKDDSDDDDDNAIDTTNTNTSTKGNADRQKRSSLAVIDISDPEPVRTAEPVKPAQRPAQRPAQLYTQRPAQKPAQRPALKPAQRPAQQCTQQPAQRPEQKPAQQQPAQQQPVTVVQPAAKPARAAKKPAVYPKPEVSVHPKPEASVTPRPRAGKLPAGAADGPSQSAVTARAVRPGYVESQDLQERMKHLDDQLKAAFKLISHQPGRKARSRPDLGNPRTTLRTTPRTNTTTNNNNNDDDGHSRQPGTGSKRPGKSWIQFFNWAKAMPVQQQQLGKKWKVLFDITFLTAAGASKKPGSVKINNQSCRSDSADTRVTVLVSAEHVQVTTEHGQQGEFKCFCLFARVFLYWSVSIFFSAQFDWPATHSLSQKFGRKRSRCWCSVVLATEFRGRRRDSPVRGDGINPLSEETW